MSMQNRIEEIIQGKVDHGIRSRAGGDDDVAGCS